MKDKTIARFCCDSGWWLMAGADREINNRYKQNLNMQNNIKFFCELNLKYRYILAILVFVVSYVFGFTFSYILIKEITPSLLMGLIAVLISAGILLTINIMED